MTVQEILKRAGIGSVEELNDPSIAARLQDLQGGSVRPQPIQDSPNFMVIPHESGNTVIADNRTGFNPAMIEQQNAVRHAADPSWYPSNTNSGINWQGDQDKIKLAKTVLDLRNQADEREYAVKTIRDKIARREIFQSPEGKWMEVQEQPDELGQMRKTHMPMSIETAALMVKAGGLKGVGIPNGDLNQVNAIKAAIASRNQPTTQDLNSFKSDKIPPSETSDEYPVLFGIPQAIAKWHSQLPQQEFENRVLSTDIGFDPKSDIPVMITNFLKKFTGGTPTDIGPSEVIRDTRTERQMIDVLRARKHLPPVSDKQWQEFLVDRGHGSDRPILR